MAIKFVQDVVQDVNAKQADWVALALRTGVGAVFVVGGWWKLSRAIDPARADALVAQYTGSSGYINAFFDQYMFSGVTGEIFSPLAFLIIFSAFELISGLALMAGLFVRAFSFFYAFFLWTFVLALPVVTAPGYTTEVPSYFSPALLVQVRDVALSGMLFVLFNLGAGAYSVDQNILGRGAAPDRVNWNAHGLVLRLSVAVVFLVGGFFAGFDHITTYAPVPLVMIAIGIVLASGYLVRPAAIAALLAVIYFSVGKLSVDASVWSNLNAFKREMGVMAACGVLIWLQGGAAFRPGYALKEPLEALAGAQRAR